MELLLFVFGVLWCSIGLYKGIEEFQKLDKKDVDYIEQKYDILIGSLFLGPFTTSVINKNYKD